MVGINQFLEEPSASVCRIEEYDHAKVLYRKITGTFANLTLNDTYTHTHTHTHPSTHRHTRARGRTPLVKESAHRKDPYLTTHNTNKRDTHPGPLRDSNPQSQQTNGRRPTAYTAWPRGSA
jgi:hypothetical protein